MFVPHWESSSDMILAIMFEGRELKSSFGVRHTPFIGASMGIWSLLPFAMLYHVSRRPMCLVTLCAIGRRII
jgi:hypothetical protein